MNNIEIIEAAIDALREVDRDCDYALIEKLDALLAQETAASRATEWQPMSEEMMEAMWRRLVADPRSASFAPFNWFVAGATAFEAMQMMNAAAPAADEPKEPPHA